MTQQEAIKAFNRSLNNTELSGRAALDEAVKASSDFTSYQAVVNKFLEDQKAAKNWHTFLVEKCGIILDNEDTGAISGADAGGDTVKIKTNIIPCEGDASYPSGSSFTVDGLTIYGIPVKSRLSEAQQYIVQGLYSWWIRDSLLLIKESYGYSYTEADTTNARLKLKFVNDTDGDFKNTLAYVSFDSSDNKEWESRVLCVNMAFFKDADTSDRHGTTADGYQLDRTLVHELVHGLMASNVNYFYDLPIFLSEGGTAELIHGIDDERYEKIIAYAKAPEVFEKILESTYTDSSLEPYGGGYIFMRYFAKQAATDTTFDYDTYRKTVSIGSSGGFATNYWDTVTMKGGKGSDTITNSGENVYITAGSGNDTVKNYSAEVTIASGAGKDNITNDGAQVSIHGGTGDDAITNNGDDGTIVGGTGVDAITNSGANSSVSGGDGNDFILNKISGFETLNVVRYDFMEPGVMAGNDAVVLISNGKSSLNAYSVELLGGNSSTLRGGDGSDNIYNHANETRIYGDAGNDQIFNYGPQSTLDGGDGDDTITNASLSVAVDVSDLIDSKLGNTAFVQSYQACIFGGDGNDSVSNACNEVEVYGENGSDSIGNTGENVSVYGGADNDYVENEGKQSQISLDDGDDEFDNYADSVKASGGAGSDTFINDGEHVTLAGDAGNDEFLNYGDFNSLSGGVGKDTIYNSGEAASIDGGAGVDYIHNEGVNVYIYGGSGNDTIRNEGEYVTISAGAGNDSIVNSGKHIVYKMSSSSGNDTFSGFNSYDTIQITSGTYSAEKSGNDVLIQVGKSTLTLKDTSDKAFYVVTATGAADTIFFDPTTQTITDDDANKQTLGAGVEVGDASSRTTAVRIVGNVLDNLIFGGTGKDTLYGKSGADSLFGGAGNDKLYGQTGNDYLDGGAGNDLLSGYSGNDTLWGGAGNNTLTGGAGVDTFIYIPNEGNDTITDYQSGELVAIDGTFTDAVFSSNKLTLTIDGGGSLIFTNVTTSTAFNINDTMYHVKDNTIK